MVIKSLRRRMLGETVMSFWRLGIAGGLVGLTLCGCDEPSEIVPVTPPGAIIPRTVNEADVAQAVGEAAPSTIKTEAPKPNADVKPMPPTGPGEIKTTDGGVKYETLKPGTGPDLKPGQRAAIQYEGKLENGQVFDSSKGRSPYPFGQSPAIKGWEEAIPGMKLGEIRKLTIPPAMAYGEQGSPPKIPPNATLIFEVELVEIK
jgi:FKBP-type peptidyl-prolyl cis-trans isomerase